jgi:hypothetical protein
MREFAAELKKVKRFRVIKEYFELNSIGLA